MHIPLMLVMGFIVNILYAMDNTDTIKIIKGTLVLHPYEKIMYSPYVQEDLKKTLDLELDAADPLVAVRALKGDGSSQQKLFLPKKFDTFPDTLPLSILRDKKDGDELILMNGTTYKIILTCNQKIHNNRAFNDQLAYSIARFKEEPTYHLFDKKELIQKGIIVKVAKGHYQHGPNGFK